MREENSPMDGRRQARQIVDDQTVRKVSWRTGNSYPIFCHEFNESSVAYRGQREGGKLISMHTCHIFIDALFRNSIWRDAPRIYEEILFARSETRRFTFSPNS